MLISYINSETLEPLTQIYFSEKKENGTLSTPILMDLDQIHVDEGPFDISKNNELYFTRSYIGDTGPVLGIFYSCLNEGVWTEPMPFKYNRPDCSVGHPALSKDEQKLYFCANYPGGFGKADIYVCEKTQGGWSKPVLLSEEINGSESELFPSIHADGSIFFSSSRKSKFAGLNIYESTIDSTGLKKAVLLPSPINSDGDDFGFSLNAARDSGLISTNRNGSDDMFQVLLTQPFFDPVPIQQVNSYCYTLYDENEFSIDTLPLKYVWTVEENVKIPGKEISYCFPGPGLYHIELNIIDTLIQDLFFSQASYDLEILDIEQPYISCPDTVPSESVVVLHAKETYLPRFNIQTYHWWINDQYFVGPEVTHSFQEGPHRVVLGVRSIPDSLGLVKQKAVYKEVFAKKGYNAQELLASIGMNSNRAAGDNIYEYLQQDSVDVSTIIPEEAVFRVEILKSDKKISQLSSFFDDVRGVYPIYETFISQDSSFSYAAGQVENLEESYPIYRDLKQRKYSEAEVKAFLPKNVINLDSLENISVEDLKQAVLRTGSILFERNSFAIDSSSMTIIDKVVRLMKQYPVLEVHIGAHTDDSGGDEFNMKLSEKRAQSVKEYLLSKGIDSSRLSYKGYGEQKPIASNTNENGKKLNRRVEFETSIND